MPNESRLLDFHVNHNDSRQGKQGRVVQNHKMFLLDISRCYKFQSEFVLQ